MINIWKDWHWNMYYNGYMYMNILKKCILITSYSDLKLELRTYEEAYTH